MKKIYLLCVLFLYATVSKGQDPTVEDSIPPILRSNANVEMPNYVNQLSPQMAQMNLYGDYPVDLSNGLVNISIPLYTIKTHDLQLPIQLKFHASGLKAEEQEGLIGMRWLLDAASYSVNRKVKGYPDGGNFAFEPRANNSNYHPDLATYYGTTAKYKADISDNRIAISTHMISHLTEYEGPESRYMDTEYDIFSYHLPSGKSGKFILRDSAGVKIPCTIPYEPIKIEVNSMPIKQITITDENGISYNYGKRSPSDQSNVEYDQGRDFEVGWNLNAIISANKMDTILFEYIKYLPSPTRLRNRGVSNELLKTDWEWGHWPSIYYQDFFRNLFFPSPSSETTLFNRGPHEGDQNKLSAIIFKEGRINFSYSAVFGSQFLSSMEILNSKNIPEKQIKFSYRRDNVGNPQVDEHRMIMLDKLSVVDINNPQNSDKEEYRFDYYNSLHYPQTGEIQADWWGYYRKEGYNVVREDNIPSFTYYIDYPYSEPYLYCNMGRASFDDKSSSVDDMKIGMIKSIEYPTGGKTIFDYESNFYADRFTGETKPCGGLRIKSIENIAANGQSEKKTYKYNPPSGCGTMPDYLHPPRILPFTYTPSVNISKNFRDKTITQARVETSSGYPAAQFSTYTYSNILPGQFADFYSNIVYYTHVVEYQGTESSNTGRTEYFYSSVYPSYTEYSHPYEGDIIHNTRQHIYVLPPRFGEIQKLKKEEVFNQNNQRLKETTYNYTPFEKGLLYDLPIKRYKHVIVVWDSPCLDPKFNEKLSEVQTIDKNPDEFFGYLNQEYVLGASRLTNQTVKEYFGSDIVTSGKDIEYDPVYLLPVKETISSSDNKTHVTNYKYPFQYNQAPYVEMTQKNILLSAVEQTAYVNNNFIEKRITDYKKWGNNSFAPQFVKLQTATQSNLETRLTYHSYDSFGNPIYISKDNAEKVVYLWSYRGQYPIAQIVGATYDEVKTALNYNDTQINALAAISSPAVTNIGNQLRIHFANTAVQISTYTYKPLVGVSTITDPRGIVTYYDYDGFGRLKEIYYYENGVVSSANKRIVEKYDYHYKNP